MNRHWLFSRSAGRSRQRGITFLGWVVLLAPLAIVGYAGIRIVPSYLNFLRVSKAIEQTQKEYNVNPGSINREAVRASLEKRFDTDYVEKPKIDEVTIRKTAEEWIIETEYEEIIPLVANASILLTFSKTATISL